MKEFVIYDDAGKILEAASVPEDLLDLQGGPGRNVLVGIAHWDTHYVLDGELALRPASPAILSGSSLTGLPAPCVITINRKEYPCSADHAEMGFTYPGVYKIKVEAFPYLDANFEVTVP